MGAGEPGKLGDRACSSCEGQEGLSEEVSLKPRARMWRRRRPSEGLRESGLGPAAAVQKRNEHAILQDSLSAGGKVSWEMRWQGGQGQIRRALELTVRGLGLTVSLMGAAPGLLGEQKDC